MLISKYFNPVNYAKELIHRLTWIYKFYIKNFTFYYSLFYDIGIVRKELESKFNKFGFDYCKGLEKLDVVLRSIGEKEFHARDGKGSIHLVLFSAISISHDIDNILEIGTFNGKTTKILSKLFPKSKITTIDLPESDPLLRNTNNRLDQRVYKQYKYELNNNILAENIEFIETNSVFLPEICKKKYDLIWVDGGHLYPEIAWDLCNAYHLCKKNGFILCDDVIINKKGYKTNYVSPDSKVVLDYITNRTNDTIEYYIKKEAPRISANPRKRKYVAVLKKKC